MKMNSLTEADPFLREYTSQDAILKYTKGTAGFGISYLLDHDYREAYLEAITHLPQQIRQGGIRMLEFGCGGGMNLLHLVSVLSRDGFNIDGGIGTDFSPVLIEAANKEAESRFRGENRGKTHFLVARNETLLDDLSLALGKQRTEMSDWFHFIFGVNTVRYCHAGKKEMDNAQDIFSLLAPGGICVVIDMNNRFPFFRSDLRNRFRSHKEEQCYVPSLEEYAAPFVQVGLELLRKEHFCWVPHSSGRFMCALLSTMSPLLDMAAKSRAMRSLVVARKPR
jgi:SAM-dependent methyltransferase